MESEYYTPNYYYHIINLLDKVASGNRELTAKEIIVLDCWLIKDGGDIADIAEANDCYTSDGKLCSTWGEIIIALRGLFASGDRIYLDI